MTTKRSENIIIYYVTILCILKITSSGETVELPLCPSNIQYFPQTLPMHCRMPANMSFGGYPGFPQMQKIAYSMPGSNGNMAPMSPMAPMAMPGGMPPGFPPGFPAPMMQPSLPVPMPAPGPKIPVIVMPFYAPDKSYSGNTPKQPGRPKGNLPSDTDSGTDDDDTDDSDSDGSGESGWWRGKKKKRIIKRKKQARKIYRRMSKRHHARKRNLLIPVLQYVTKDGYVIFEKKISKPEAKQWLEFDKKPAETGQDIEHKRKNELIERDESELIEFDADNLENSEEDHKEVANPIKKNVVEYKPNRRKQNPNLNQNKEQVSRHYKKPKSS